VPTRTEEAKTVKVEVKFTPEQATKAQRGERYSSTLANEEDGMVSQNTTVIFGGAFYSYLG
jgi:hypothetical protein